MPGGRELLLALRHHGVRCVIATSASDEMVDALLKIAGVSDLIDARATANDAEQSKAAVDIVHAALLAARSRRVNSVMLGDTRYDVQASAAADVSAIALRCGVHPSPTLPTRPRRSIRRSRSRTPSRPKRCETSSQTPGGG